MLFFVLFFFSGVGNRVICPDGFGSRHNLLEPLPWMFWKGVSIEPAEGLWELLKMAGHRPLLGIRILRHPISSVFFFFFPRGGGEDSSHSPTPSSGPGITRIEMFVWHP